MFITPDFIEKYSKRADEITIDGLKLNLYPAKHSSAIAAYLYDMYMKVRQHVPVENLFEDLQTADGGEESKIKKNEVD